MPLFSHKKKTEMPKNLTDLVDKVEKPILVEEPTPVVEELTHDPFEEPTPVADAKPVEFPEYILNDPEIVGYVDEETQMSFYKLAVDGIDIDVNTSIMDLGCGRGDFFKYIYDLGTGCTDYVGYELNGRLLDAGMIKYKDFDIIDFKHENFLNPIPKDTDPLEYQTADWTFNILNLALNYDNHSTDKWEHFDAVLAASMLLCEKGSIFILLSDNGGVQEYVHHPIDEVVKRIQDKYMFAIDRTSSTSIYKLGI